MSVRSTDAVYRGEPGRPERRPCLNKEISPLFKLDLFQHIGLYLGPVGIAACGRVCKEVKLLCDTPNLLVQSIDFIRLGNSGRGFTVGFLGDTNSTLERLVQLNPNLRSLSLSGSNITNEGVDFLTHLPYLEKLDLSSCKNLTGNSLYRLRGIPLKKLSIMGSKIDDNGLSNLRDTPLESLALNGCPITDQGLANLGPKESLHTLSFDHCKQITGAGVRHLSQFPNLKSLSMSFCEGIAPDGFDGLAALSSLESLRMGGCRVTALTLSDIQHLPSLIALDILGCPGVNDYGLRQLQNLRLQSLELSSDEVTDLGVSYLAGLPLRKLNLSCCHKITPRCFPHIQSLPHLEEFNLISCQVSAQEKDRLMRLLLTERSSKRRKTGP